jgi:hypothetical protein
MNSRPWAASLILAFAGPLISQTTPSEFTTYIGDANTIHVARIRTDATIAGPGGGEPVTVSLTRRFAAN